MGKLRPVLWDEVAKGVMSGDEEGVEFGFAREEGVNLICRGCYDAVEEENLELGHQYFLLVLEVLNRLKTLHNK